MTEEIIEMNKKIDTLTQQVSLFIEKSNAESLETKKAKAAEEAAFIAWAAEKAAAWEAREAARKDLEAKTK